MEKNMNWDEYEKIGEEIFKLAKSKNADYGTKSLEDFGTKGCLIRLYDKVNRLKHLVWNEYEPDVETEKIEDTCMDIVNYAVYLIMLERESLTKNAKRK